MSYRVDNKVKIQYLEISENLEVFDEKLDKIIIEERNEDLKKLERDLEELVAVNYTLTNLVQEQGSGLEIAADNIVVTEKAVTHVVEDLKHTEEKTNNKRKTKVFASIGAASGAGIGSVGFILGPPIGLATTLVGAAVGAITGAIIGKVKSKNS